MLSWRRAAWVVLAADLALAAEIGRFPGRVLPTVTGTPPASASERAAGCAGPPGVARLPAEPGVRATCVEPDAPELTCTLWLPSGRPVTVSLALPFGTLPLCLAHRGETYELRDGAGRSLHFDARTGMPRDAREDRMRRAVGRVGDVRWWGGLAVLLGAHGLAALASKPRTIELVARLSGMMAVFAAIGVWYALRVSLAGG